MNHMKEKSGTFVIKVDLVKAYNNLSWQFVEKILNEAGFPHQMRKVIMKDISTVKMKFFGMGMSLISLKQKRGLGKVILFHLIFLFCAYICYLI